LKIYISGTFTAQDRLRTQAERLHAAGHEIISSWLYEGPRPAHLNIASWNRELAIKDLAEVFSGDCIILDRDGESTTGGRYVEWGMACSPRMLKVKYTVGGGKLGVFDHLADRHFKDWDELVAWFGVNHNAR